MDLQIRPIDTSDEAQLRQWYAAVVASVKAGRPSFVPMPFEEQTRQLIEPELGAERVDLVALEDGEVSGAVMIWLPLEDNLETAWVITDVAPQHRRRGIGRALVAAAEERIPQERRTLITQTKYPAERRDDHPYRLFCEAMGYSLTTTATIRELPWPVDRAELDRLAVDPAPYRVETHVDGVPEEQRASLGVLKGLIDVDAPSGDLEWEPSPMTPEHYAEELRRHVAAGRRLVESVALNPDGEVVAYTEVVVPSIGERNLRQEGTLVRTDHRGHRLGIAVKTANLRRLLDMGLTNPCVATSNDDANTWMVAVNDALGFVPVEVEGIFAKRR